ncbi:iron permease [Brevibacillus sp. SYP-B805]|uniref:FTR1 family protein n=1 Tax=Brevibacillus sp. SYP-B805 TaxID=1578199 RepID=UPI0013EBA856|nr:FTR1 family protein [Brevibacillus sp. SYP-B805]NGQ95132.1 iron permease [Brevibacillus sp. SYP-B805]
MNRKMLVILQALLLMAAMLLPLATHAATKAESDLAEAQAAVTQALDLAKAGKLDEAKKAYDTFNDTWRKIEDGVKEESGTAYKEIESHMGKVVYAFMQGKPQGVAEALEGLHAVNETFIHGGYQDGGQFQQQNLSLADFVQILRDTKENVDNHEQEAALQGMNQVADSWLSVEGIVVSQSAAVYSDSEKDIVTASAMLEASPPDYAGASRVLDGMIRYLTPLAEKSSYSLWDAAMIILREGLEALLVVTALLAFVGKSNQPKGKGWIWGGVSVGMLVSIAIAVVIKMAFSSGAFGSNNALIAGWTGVIAAAMLLYVSYWLHSQSSLAGWNRYIREKSESALTTGRLISLGTISFLAVFREGTETVLFFIGMVNQISIQNMLIGILLGFGLLAVLAYLIIFIGVKLPIKPFFLISSVFVFYLCLKFTGMGIHSLQLAGVLPSSLVPYLPSIDLLAFYPSLESSIPQIGLLLIAVVVVIRKKWVSKQIQA